MAFKVLDGLDEDPNYKDSKNFRLDQAEMLGFVICPYLLIDSTVYAPQILNEHIKKLQDLADNNGIPIDGIVVTYDSISYSNSCGKTGRFYKDGLAYKFEDDTHETVLREIEWTPSRTGSLAPVAIFDTVVIDGCEVSRATLHNLTFIKELELIPGCRILVAKRNMIIPHVEDNLDRGSYQDFTPPLCPCCSKKTRIYSRTASNGRVVETLHCDNPDCESQIIRKFLHFTSKKAMNIEGLSKSALQKFLEAGYIQSFQDIYHLDKYHDSIVQLEGFGEKSYERLWDAIQKSRNTTFSHYLTAMDIPMVGSTTSRLLGSSG